MFLARVTGTVVATQKVASMTGHKLLTVEPLRVEPETRNRLIGTGRTFVCFDTVGAGQGEIVLIVQGSSARLVPDWRSCRRTQRSSASSTPCKSRIRPFSSRVI